MLFIEWICQINITLKIFYNMMLDKICKDPTLGKKYLDYISKTKNFMFRMITIYIYIFFI